MVDEGGDAPVGVQFEVLRFLLLTGPDVDFTDVVLQPELLEYNGDLPAEHIKSSASQLRTSKSSTVQKSLTRGWAR